MVIRDLQKILIFGYGLTKRTLRISLRALQDFGFSSLDISEDDFLSPGYVVQLGQPPGRIDLLTSVTGLEFEECYASRVHANIQGSEVDFIDLDNFKKNKKAVGRHQDLADLENLD